MKKKRSYENILQIINTVVVVIILAIYGFRFIYFKQRAYTPQDVSDKTFFSNVVKDFTNVDLSKEDRIYKNEDDTYVFVGKDVDNYVKYSNILFRILGVDEEGNVKLVSEESVGLSTLNEVDVFEDTSLYSFLNKINSDELSGILEKSLYKYTAFRSYEGKIGLLTLDDYRNASGKTSYLNNGTFFWTMSQNEEGKYIFINDKGEAAPNYSDYLSLPIRFTISIKYSALLKGGSGRIDSPYILDDEIPETVKDIKTGSYVKYADKIWRITNNGHVYGYDYQNITKTSFKDIDSFKNETGIYSYLNNEYLNTLDNYEKYLIKDKWYYGSFDDSYTYKDCLKNEYESYISLPILSSLFINNDDEYLLGVIDNYSNEYIYAINNENIYGVSLNQEIIIKPIVSFNLDIKIIDGLGSYESPYILED